MDFYHLEPFMYDHYNIYIYIYQWPIDTPIDNGCVILYDHEQSW